MKNESDALEASILQLVQRINPTQLFVAYSGGVDSTVLLRVLANLKIQKLLAHTITAIHINHNLQPEADLWAEHCQVQCAELGIAIKVVKVTVDKTLASLEAQARTARYAAFSKILERQDALLLAQHQDDQVETVFLRLLRGAGAHGLSAMHAVRKLERGVLLRPWLDVPKAQIIDYAQSQNLNWIEDDSNQDTRMDRNFLRYEIIPRLKTRWPGLNKTVSRTAKLLKANRTSLISANPELPLENINELEIELAASRVHQWLLSLGAPLPSHKKIVNIVTELAHAVDDAIPHVSWNGGEVRRHAGKLYYFTEKQSLARIDFNLNFTGTELIKMGDDKQNLKLKSSSKTYATLKLKSSQDTGIKVLANDKISIKFPQGGEQIKPEFGKHTKKLKKIFQEKKIPPWDRVKIPLIFINDKLAQVIGICAAADFALLPEESGIQINIQKQCER